MSHYEASPRPGAVRPTRSHATAPSAVGLGSLARCIPIALLVLAAVWGLAWQQHGSPTARDWLKYALFGAFVVAGVFVSGRAKRPSPPATLALGALGGTAILATISITYAPVPNLARDEALLTVFYAACFAVPALMLRSRADRTYAMAVVAAGSMALSVFAAVGLLMHSHAELLFYGGRLNYPITYPNGQAAAMLIGFWPALAIAARRASPVWLRSLALAGATSMLAGWLLSQSKGGALGLIASAAVVFALSQRRLRLFVPFVFALGLAAIGAVPLTAPIRATGSPVALRAAVHHSAAVLLWLTVAGAALGLVYALADRRMDVPDGARKALGRLVGIVVALALIGGPALYFVTHESPTTFVSRQWTAFKQPPASYDTTSHLLTLGSDRYDVWRVAFKEFGDHPIFGIGSRGFGPAYLQYGKSQETPARAHSMPLDTLAELGLLGFVVLLLVFAPPIATVARRAGGELTAVGTLGGIVYFLAHACVDWIWTIPAVGVLAMLLLAIGASAAPVEPRAFARRTTFAAAGAIALIALIAFVPPWLSARYAQRAARGGVGLDGDITWAKRLDPLSIDAYLAQARWSGTLEGALTPLRQAVELQPGSYATHYLYGIDLLKVGRLEEAHAELFRAWQLAPRDPYVNAALKLAPFARPER